ncbi:secreted RxLR effector protein 161-like [Cicer arietinum]|uniref:secreted RxLR effector protein 161-like n=1 Tax=Cicer arietinum TaxID=3827 RepID=UPI003CC63485
MEKVVYAFVVGSLMYAQVCTCPDIAFVVNSLGKYLSNPGLGHWKIVKKVLRYLQEPKIICKNQRLYSDSDFPSFPDDPKSTSNLIFMMVGEAIYWQNVKKTLTATSTMEAEYIACYKVPCQAMWLKNLISRFKFVESISRPLVK